MVPEIPMIDNPAADDFMDALSEACQVTYDTLHDATALMKRFTDQKWKESPTYAVGQQVWLDAQNLKTKCPSKKLDIKHLSPFEVIDQFLMMQQVPVPTTWHFCLCGKFTQYSTCLCYDPPNSIHAFILQLLTKPAWHWNLSEEKRSLRLKTYWTIREASTTDNILLSGKATH
jgi:hypothetical protein